MAGGASFRDRSDDLAGNGIDDGQAVESFLGDEETGLLGMGCDCGDGEEQERNGEALGLQLEPPGRRKEFYRSGRRAAAF